MAYLYILECSGGAYYTGIAKDVDARLAVHRSGRGAKYTRLNPPVRVLYRIKLRNWSTAMRLERLVKSWPRKKKTELVRGGVDALAELREARRKRLKRIRTTPGKRRARSSRRR